jgi:hypothetical protein
VLRRNWQVVVLERKNVPLNRLTNIRDRLLAALSLGNTTRQAWGTRPPKSRPRQDKQLLVSCKTLPAALCTSSVLSRQATRITSRRLKRAPPANPASEKPGASKLKCLAAVRVPPLVGRSYRVCLHTCRNSIQTMHAASCHSLPLPTYAPAAFFRDSRRIAFRTNNTWHIR